MNHKKTISLWPPLLLMVFIFIESSIPMDGGSDNIAFLTDLDPEIQNLLYIPLYGALAFLMKNGEAFKVPGRKENSYPARKLIIIRRQIP